MKPSSVIFLTILISLTSCGPSPTDKQHELVITNPSDFQRVDEPVIVPRDAIEAALGALQNNDIIAVIDNERVIPGQLDDLDNDGQWDELAFVVSIESSGKKAFKIEKRDETQEKSFEPRTNIRFAALDTAEKEIDSLTVKPVPRQGKVRNPYQVEGPAWENDLIGFRHYFDARNGLDIFGKTTSSMMLDDAGINEDYHQMQDWGMDILKVGNSLGAGALAAMIGDNIVRLGMTEGKTYNKVIEGPVRSILRFDYQGWQIGDKSVDISHQISIWAGQHYYTSDVTLTSANTEIEIVTGFVNLLAEDYALDTYSSGFTALSTFATQGELDSQLGMGIVLHSDYVNRSGAAPEEGDGVTDSYYITSALSNNQSFSFDFFTVWQPRHQLVDSVEAFEQLIEQHTNKKASPLSVAFQ